VGRRRWGGGGDEKVGSGEFGVGRRDLESGEDCCSAGIWLKNKALRLQKLNEMNHFTLKTLVVNSRRSKLFCAPIEE
jgi:hypothetical protein